MNCRKTKENEYEKVPLPEVNGTAICCCATRDTLRVRYKRLRRLRYVAARRDMPAAIEAFKNPYLRQQVLPWRARTSAEFALSSRRCTIVLREGENADRKTKIQIQWRNPLAICERVSTLIAFYYAGSSSEAKSINGLINNPFLFFDLCRRSRVVNTFSLRRGYADQASGDGVSLRPLRYGRRRSASRSSRCPSWRGRLTMASRVFPTSCSGS